MTSGGVGAPSNNRHIALILWGEHSAGGGEMVDVRSGEKFAGDIRRRMFGFCRPTFSPINCTPPLRCIGAFIGYPTWVG